MELIQKHIKNQLNVYFINDISNIIFEYADDSHFYSNEINKSRTVRNEYLTRLKDIAAKSVTIIGYFKNLEKIVDFAKDINEMPGIRQDIFHNIREGVLYFHDDRGASICFLESLGYTTGTSFDNLYDDINLKIYEGWERFVNAYDYESNKTISSTNFDTLESLFEFVNLYQ